MTLPQVIFEESSALAFTRKLTQRDVDLDSIIKLSDFKIISITGARRTGKSSLLMLIAQELAARKSKVAYINAEDMRIPSETLLDDALKWFGEEGYLLIDEVTSAHDWHGWLARNHDFLKGRLRIIVSSSRSGLVLPPKILRGRVHNIEIFPLSFKEFLGFHSAEIIPTTAGRGAVEKRMREYLQNGGFPEIALLDEKALKSATLIGYFEQILALDVADSSRSEIAMVKTFGRYALNSPYFSATKCLNHMKGVGHKIGKERILELEHYSQQSYLFFFVPVYGRSIKERERYPRKCYPVDVGFFSSSGIEDQGRILETVVFLQVRRMLKADEDILYWRGEKDEEVDILVKKWDNTTSAIQVCMDLTDPRTRAREIGSLSRCLDELKLKKGLIVTYDRDEEKADEDGRVELMSLRRFLLERYPESRDR